MKNDRVSGSLLASLIGYGLTVLALFFCAGALEYRLWGLNWYGYFGWYVWLALAAAVLIVPVVLLGWRRYHDRPASPATSGRSLFPIFSFLILVVAGLAFYFFRGQTHFLGDGYQLLSWLQSGTHLKSWGKGTYLVQSWVFDLIGGDRPDALPALQLVSYLSGLLLLLGAAISAARLFDGLTRRLLFVIGLAGGGYMLLFFGYLESYPLFVCSVGWFCLTGLMVSRGRAPRWLPLIPLAFATMFHIFAVALLPGAIYTLHQGSFWGDRIAAMKRSTRVLVSVGIGAVSLAVFIYLYLDSYYFRFNIVPLWPDRHTVEGYWLLSADHLLDYFNQVFLLLPGILILVPLFFSLRVRARVIQPDCLFLLFVLVPSFAIVFLANPGLGMPRDWDLFSFAGLPLVILFYYLLLDRDGPHHGPRIAILGITLGLLLLGPRVATQVDPELGITLFDRYAALDRIKNSSGRFILREYLKKHDRGDEAERRRRIDNEILPEGEWVETARKLIAEGRTQAGAALLFKAIESDPSQYMAWGNLGTAYSQHGLYDSARYYLEIAAARMPFNAPICINLADVYVALEEYDRAEKLFLEACELAPDNFVPRRLLLRLYDRRSRFEDYQVLLERLTERNDVPADILLQAARSKLWAWETVAATEILRRALDAGLDTAIVCELQTQYPELKVIDCDS